MGLIKPNDPDIISFNKNSVLQLRPLEDLSKIKDLVRGMLIPGEEILMAFAVVRDQLIFTNKRIIAVNVRGVTGMKKLFLSMPYQHIQYFGVQTPGFMEIITDAELTLYFSNGICTQLEFQGKTDIALLAKTISRYTLVEK